MKKIAPVLALLLLSGLGSVAVARNRVTLVLLKHYNAFEKDYDAFLAEGFEKTHPNVTVHVTLPQTGAVYTKFQTMAAGGSPPNVYLAYETYVAELLSLGALSPVDYHQMGVSGASQLAEAYISPSILKVYTYHGKLYGVPEEVSNYAAFVNKHDYQAAGLSLPKTWEEVCADGPKLSSVVNGVVAKEELALPVSFAPAEILIINAISSEYGTPLFNEAGTRSNLLAPAVIHAFTMLQNLVYKCHAFYPALNGTTTAAERELYGEGKAAMVLDVGSWYTPLLQQHYQTVWKQTTVVPYPTIPGHASVSPAYGYAYVVPREAPHQDLDWQYVHFLQKVGDVAFKLGLYSGLRSLDATETAATFPFWKSVWIPTLKTGVYLPLLARGSQIQHIIGAAYDSILLDHANVTATLKAADARITPLLNKN